MRFSPSTPTRRGVTKSGRVYKLIGEPGFDADADYVWMLWQPIQGCSGYQEVTAEVVETILSSKQAE